MLDRDFAALGHKIIGKHKLAEVQKMRPDCGQPYIVMDCPAFIDTAAPQWQEDQARIRAFVDSCETGEHYQNKGRTLKKMQSVRCVPVRVLEVHDSKE